MAAFKAFKPSGMEKIARSMGYTGNMNTFGDYLAQDPMRQNQMNEYTNRAMRMAEGGAVTSQPSVESMTPAVEPTPTPQPVGTSLPQAPVPIQTIQPLADGSAPTIGDVSAQRMQQPGLPVGGVAVAQGITQTPGQIIDPTLGQVQGSVLLL